MRYSIVVPVFNEMESLKDIHREVSAAFQKLGKPYEVLFVDDGSTDGSTAVLEELAAEDDCVRVIELVRNYGKSSAYAAGFESCRGELVVTMDADLQDNPREAGKLVRKLEEDGLDLVIGWKLGRGGNEPMKTFPSRIYNWLKGNFFGLWLRDSNSGFRVMKREVAATLNLYGDQYRFIPELAHLRGFRVGEVPVRHRRRRFGKSKYGAMRFWTGILDLINVRFLTSYAPKPLHFFGRFSLVPILLGGVLEVYVLIQKFLGSSFQTHVAAIMIGALLIMVGVQFLSIGLVCEMIAAEARGPRYHIRRRLGGNTQEKE